jgi:hypothetical protein
MQVAAHMYGFLIHYTVAHHHTVGKIRVPVLIAHWISWLGKHHYVHQICGTAATSIDCTTYFMSGKSVIRQVSLEDKSHKHAFWIYI